MSNDESQEPWNHYTQPPRTAGEQNEDDELDFTGQSFDALPEHHTFAGRQRSKKHENNPDRGKKLMKVGVVIGVGLVLVSLVGMILYSKLHKEEDLAPPQAYRPAQEMATGNRGYYPGGNQVPQQPQQGVLSMPMAGQQPPVMPSQQPAATGIPPQQVPPMGQPSEGPQAPGLEETPNPLNMAAQPQPPLVPAAIPEELIERLASLENNQKLILDWLATEKARREEAAAPKGKEAKEGKGEPEQKTKVQPPKDPPTIEELQARIADLEGKNSYLRKTEQSTRHDLEKAQAELAQAKAELQQLRKGQPQPQKAAELPPAFRSAPTGDPLAAWKITGISDGVAIMTDGKRAEAVKVGTLLDGVRIEKIDPAKGEVVTSSGIKHFK